MRQFLLLDDNRAFAENIAEILRDAGASATVVTDGAEALSSARSTRFDVLLTDMKMPGLSGAAAVHHTRRVEPGLAAVVLTASPVVMTAYPEFAEAESAAGIFLKPFDTAALMSAVEQAHAVRSSAA